MPTRIIPLDDLQHLYLRRLVMSRGFCNDNDDSRYDFDDGYGYRKSDSHTSRRDDYYDYDDYDLNAFSEDNREYEDIYSSSEYSEESRGVYRRNKKRKKSCLMSALSLILVVLLAFGTGYILIAYSIAGNVNFKDYERITFSSSGENEFSTLSSQELQSKRYVRNIMLFGIDGDSSDYGRSDTMMLLSIDSRHRELKLTSFQRDTYIHCPDPEGDYRTKLTNAFSYGGIPLAIATVETNYGVRVDNYASVNFETFKSVVDTLGGVEIELTEREILYINCQIAQNNQTEYLDAEPGVVLLNGQQALWYARNRGGDIINGVDFYEDTDWDRTERQRKFLDAVLSKLRSANPMELGFVLKNVLPDITTDLSRGELTMLIACAPFYLTFDLEECSVPTDGTWVYDYNFAGDIIYVTDWDTVRQEFRTYIYDE